MRSPPIECPELVAFVDLSGADTKRPGDAREIDGWVTKVHTDKVVCSVERLQALLDNPISSVVEQYDSERQVGARLSKGIAGQMCNPFILQQGQEG